MLKVKKNETAVDFGHYRNGAATAEVANVAKDIAAKNTIIKAENIEKTYDMGQVQVHALRGVDLEIERGELVAIMGPSGCGKTTLLNCLSGLDSIDAGAIYLNGSPLHEMADRKRTTFRAQHMGFIFQSYNLLPVLNAVENVELPLLVTGVGVKEARQRAVAMLEKVGLADKVHNRPAELSGGQQQRVTIARALVNNPAIIWGDEPTGALDTKASDEIMALLETLNQENQQTVVMVTHSSEVAARADRVLYIRDGLIDRVAYK